ncbi:MAG: hypothetical protein ABIK28_21085 [Planctomycetota bacterium]
MGEHDLRILPYEYDDELIDATLTDRMPRVRVDRPRRTSVVLGRGSKPEDELDVEACLQDGVPVLKRRGGGCSVVLDTGNLIVSVILPMKGTLNAGKLFDPLSGWLIRGLQQIGIKGVYSDGISDLVLEDRKIGGACIYRSKEILYYSTTLLVHPAMDKVTRYLRHPPREPEYRKGRSHALFMGSLAPFYWSHGVDTLSRSLRGVLCPGDAMLAVKGGTDGRKLGSGDGR